MYVTVNYPGKELGFIVTEYPLLVNISLASILFDLTIVSYFRRKWAKHSGDVSEYVKQK